MLKLKDVSKFYYNKGIIAPGFTKVSLELNLGEFVVITGESGSGKSTLLNVISGMDSYEEGEMFIDGNETSHYMESDFEDYRNKYISNIFQNFNLVNSYTVYQNVELVLLISGNKRSKVKKKVLNILKEVDLYKFRNTKVSKLSGGQKQRVAIARALAKESQIIIADEPTGNLDTKSAESVLTLLNKISKDKLVVIVTHNYKQVEQYATRTIKMHDGKIAEDKNLKDIDLNIKPQPFDYKNITVFNKLRLGLRNTFNIIPKFLLLLAVFAFIVSGFLLVYSAFKKAEYEESKLGFNDYFRNRDDKRIILKKPNNESFNEDDYLKIESLNNIDYIVKDDLLLDNNIGLQYEDLYIYALLKDLKTLDGKPDVGRMPENDYEIILSGYKNDYYISYQQDILLNNKLSLTNEYSNFSNDYEFQVVGIKYIKQIVYGVYEVYGSEFIINKSREISELRYSNLEVLLNNKVYESNPWSSFMQIAPSDKVEAGHAYVSAEFNYMCSSYNCRNKKINILNRNMYYEKDIDLTIARTYTKNNFGSITGDTNFDDNQGKVYINRDDYKSLFTSDYYQSSVIIDDIKFIDEVNNNLIDLGFETLLIKDILINYNDGATQILKIVRLVVTIILVVVMFFISYFIIKLILKSRNVYFTTIRILGSSKKVSKQLMDIELFAISNLAYFGFVIFFYLIKINTIDITYLNELVKYLQLTDYLIIYFIVMFMTQLISSKFSKSLFKKSAMKTFGEVI